MRTLILIAVGLISAIALLRITPAPHRNWAVGIFTVVWLLACAWNLRVGLSHGYSLDEELPIHAALFGIPALAAWGLWWWARRT